MEEDTIFGKIVRKEIPAHIVFESENVLAFKDISPQAPTHIVIIPKKAICSMKDVSSADRELLGDLLLAASEIARSFGLDDGGYRIVINTGSRAGQSVFHLHLHLLGGRIFGWPPG